MHELHKRLYEQRQSYQHSSRFSRNRALAQIARLPARDPHDGIGRLQLSVLEPKHSFRQILNGWDVDMKSPQLDAGNAKKLPGIRPVDVVQGSDVTSPQVGGVVQDLDR